MELTGKNILVTGGTGFIGSHLVEYLISEKNNVVVSYQSLNRKSYFFSKKLEEQVILVHKDLKNFKRTLDVVTRYEIDLIFHLAAQALVTVAYYNPLETVETNMMGTAHILEAARLYGKVKGIIVTSSDKAYGKIAKASESNPVGGDHPYETSKAAADLLSTTYFKTYGLPVVVTRFGNVYGEGDLNFSRIIPGIMKTIIKKGTLAIRSNGRYWRDYVYVADVIAAMVLLTRHIKKVQGETFNISSNENLSVLELVKKIEKILGKKIAYRIQNIAVNEIPAQSVDFTKIRKRLGWKPKNNLAATIKPIFDWYNQYFS